MQSGLLVAESIDKGDSWLKYVEEVSDDALCEQKVMQDGRPGCSKFLHVKFTRTVWFMWHSRKMLHGFKIIVVLLTVNWAYITSWFGDPFKWETRVKKFEILRKKLNCQNCSPQVTYSVQPQCINLFWQLYKHAF